MIKLASETIDKSDIKKLIGWLKTHPKLTQGNLTKNFESKFANWIGTKYAIFCNSGSSANLLMLSALLENRIIKKNSKVVVPSICWSTDVAPIFQLNLNPILCDIDLESLSLDLRGSAKSTHNLSYHSTKAQQIRSRRASRTKHFAIGSARACAATAAPLARRVPAQFPL